MSTDGDQKNDGIKQPASNTPASKRPGISRQGSSTVSSRSLPYWATDSRHGRANLPWSMNLMKMCCQDCGADWPPPNTAAAGSNNAHSSSDQDDEEDDDDIKERYEKIYADWKKSRNAAKSNGAGDSALATTSHTITTKTRTVSLKSVSPHVVTPMLDMVHGVYCTPTNQTLLEDYHKACQLYGTMPNSGVMATLRFSLPAMRVAGPFHDADMLSLGEFLLTHANTSLSYLKRLDFSRASKEGKLHGKPGFRSHGALVLAKVLTISEHIEQVRLQRHRIGPYGASALFLAASNNKVLQSLVLRRCQIGERGALAFAEIVCPSRTTGLQDIDLSANRIGFRGCLAIEKALQQRGQDHSCLSVDLEGNLVFQEVMNGVTHGMGMLLAILGSMLMYQRVQHGPVSHFFACAIYSASLLLLYTSSTLYHSFFTMQNTKYIFEALDKCAIYILIAGSYTPFLLVKLGHNPMWSIYLLIFIWTCCIGGIYVEITAPAWKHKKIFSLLMYLGMGWACVVCLPELSSLMPQPGTHLLIMGGVGYTSGVPFFVRNNNLDHSIWHLFVLSGSLFHWLCVYWYVIPTPTIVAATCAVAGGAIGV